MKKFFADLFSFTDALHVIRFICVALILVLIIVEIVMLILRLTKKKNNAQENNKTTEPAESETAETQAEETTEPVTETPVEEVKEVEEEPPVQPEAVEEVQEEVKEEPKPEENQAIVIADLSDDLEVAKRVPFKDKILASEEKIQTYYTEVENAFRAYRNINTRLSIKGLSFRQGRELVAKMTIRGRTLKLHLALDVNEFEQNIYFQKDMSDVKEYVEVPFAVKIRSDRALKNALVLIEKLAEKHGIEKKVRYTKVDSIAKLKDEE